MIAIIQELMREFIRTLAWVRLCNDDEPETWRELAISLFVCLLRILVFLVIAMLGTSQKDPVAGILIGGFLALLVFVPFYLVYRFRLSRLNAAITKAEAELAAVNRELADHHTRYNYGLIPEGYRHSDALSFILDALGTRRAQTIQHAIYLYEELTQREYVEQSRQTQIGLQNKFNPGSRLHRAETPVSGPNLAQEILKGAAGDAGSAIVANQLRQRK